MAYHKITVAKEFIIRSVITTPFGLFTFGLSSVWGAKRKHFISDAPLAQGHTDHLLITSQDLPSHEQQVTAMLRQPNKNRMRKR